MLLADPVPTQERSAPVSVEKHSGEIELVVVKPVRDLSAVMATALALAVGPDEAAWRRRMVGRELGRSSCSSGLPQRRRSGSSRVEFEAFPRHTSHTKPSFGGTGLRRPCNHILLKYIYQDLLVGDPLSSSAIRRRVRDVLGGGRYVCMCRAPTRSSMYVRKWVTGW